jgi:hypothetical protein
MVIASASATVKLNMAGAVLPVTQEGVYRLSVASTTLR